MYSNLLCLFPPMTTPVYCNFPLHRRWLLSFKLLALIALIALFGSGRQALAALPSGWVDGDVGSPSIGGSASFTNGLWTVSGGGSDIWNASDQFNFVSLSFFGDGSIAAKVTSLQNTDPSTGWSKAGVMFRNDNSAGAINAAVVVSAANGVNFQWRSAAGGQSSSANASGIVAPAWVKLVRSGTNFSGFYSVDGTNWIQIGMAQSLSMNGVVLAGLAVTAHNNSALNTAAFTNVTVLPQIFGVYRELWTNLNSSAGNTLAALTNTTYNPNWPNSPVAAFTKLYTNFEANVDIGINYYGQRLRAFVVPPTAGNYTFWISSDDTSELFLSSDENPVNKIPIAWVNTWDTSRQWDKELNQQSAPIALQAGCRYYLEAIMQQGTGGDNLAVRWQLPNGTIEEPMTAISPASSRLVPCNGINTLPGIYAQSTNITAFEGDSFVLSVLSTNEAPVAYQWQLNGTNLMNAAQPVYAISNASLAVNNGQIYACVISNSIGAVTSAPISLTITRDTNPPVLLSAQNLGITNVQVFFSKLLETASATNIANYVFTNGTPVTAAAMDVSGNWVVLTTSPLTYGSNYSLVVNGVRDRASQPNTIATNSTVGFTASPFTTQDIGSPPTSSVITLLSNGVQVAADGYDVGGAADQ